jgi:23S rRNA pseudouridine1911/1915/1917 synthase
MNNNQMQKQEITIPESHTGDRLDQALAKLMPTYSRSQIKEWIDSGNVTLNGEHVKAKVKVNDGDVVCVTPVARPEITYEAEDIPLNIIHEDEAIIIINKPPGLVVHPGAGNTKATMLNALLHHCPQLKQLPRAGILHRLDKNTSGLLVIAKTEDALRDLSAQLKNRDISREYQALVYGELISGGTVDAPIDRHPVYRTRMGIVETGKSAITHYRVMERYRSITRLKVKLETGRTHQIRVHMSHTRHPLVGDTLYGGRVQLAKGMSDELIQALRGFKRQALHAFELGFIHPVSKEWVTYKADLPDDMSNLIDALKKDVSEK